MARKASSVGPMRVPPSQSSTSAAARASAASRSRTLQRARDAGQPRAEREHLDAIGGLHGGMGELQIVAGVQLHRAGNVDQDQQPALTRSGGGAAAARARRRRRARSSAASGADRACRANWCGRERKERRCGKALGSARRKSANAWRSVSNDADAKPLDGGSGFAALLLPEFRLFALLLDAVVVLDLGVLVAFAIHGDGRLAIEEAAEQRLEFGLRGRAAAQAWQAPPGGYPPCERGPSSVTPCMKAMACSAATGKPKRRRCRAKPAKGRAARGRAVTPAPFRGCGRVRD